MGFIDTGLTDSGSGRGKTTHYAFAYDDALESSVHPGQPEPARTNALIASAETDFDLMNGWFGNIGLPYGLPVSVNVENAGGGAHWGPPIGLDPGSGDANLCRFLMVAEVTEMLMLKQNRGWFAPDGSNEQSSGEGLSHFLAGQFLIENNLPLFTFISNIWMNSSRDDFVNHIDEYDHSNSPKSACSLLFLYYLFVQLGFSINEIVGAAGPELSDVYHNLTGDPGDPFPFFKRLLDVAFPGTAQITSGPNLDNPYPVGILSFWVDKSTFGRDEVADALVTHGGRFAEAFWLVLEGFSIDSFNSLHIDVEQPTGPFANLPGITIGRSPIPVHFENTANTKVPQRIRIAYDVTFTQNTLNHFPQPTDGPANYSLHAAITSNGTDVPGGTAVTDFELIGGEDPYFTNIDPTTQNVFYLSQDLRVFTATPALNNVPVAGGPTFPSDSVAGAFGYLQSLLTHLNSNYSDPTGQDPFSSVLPGQGGALTGDSSVTPFHFDFSDIFHPQIDNNYNFAIARVRLRAPSGSPAAENVRVFFRLWSTQTADTDYQDTTTYAYTPDAAGFPGSPLVGANHHTLPFFATGNLNNQTDYVPGGVNALSLSNNGTDQSWFYYGCFLNLYDSANQVDGQQIQHWLNGSHHCLVAQIAYDGAPIINANGVTESPQNSDKLAQRNLQVTTSDNPGPASAHRVPQTFDVRPSPALADVAGLLLDYPDELMIDWGHVPVGSVAHIFWPQASAAEVIDQASRLYGSHLLTVDDPNTVACTVTDGITYVPIPHSVDDLNLTGLLTIDLPTTVVAGQEFEVQVRRVATRRGRFEKPRPPVAVPGIAEPAARPPVAAELADRPSSNIDLEPPSDVEPEPSEWPKTGMRNWRYVVGSFGVRIPVGTSATLLLPEQNTLAIMKWRLANRSPADRWYRVLQRYVGYLSDRVDGLGGDSSQVLPSPDGFPLPGGEHGGPGGHGHVGHRHVGKVAALLYDRFGDFEGFILDTEDGDLRFAAREHEMETVVARAWAQRIVTVVIGEVDERPHQVLLLSPPPPA